MPAQPVRLSNRVSALWTVGISVIVIGVGLLVPDAPLLPGFLVFLPAVTAGFASLQHTAWVSAWVMLAAVVIVVRNSSGGPGERVAVLLLVAAFCLFAVYLCWWRLARTEENAQLRFAAAALQQQLLRPLPVLTSETTVSGIYEPLREEHLVGGDVYDVVDTAFGTRVLIGDVEGKGLPALGATFAVVGAFREAAHREPTMTGLVEALEQAVVRQNRYARQAGEPERFVTALVLDVDDRPEIQVINCGHPLPYVVGTEGVYRMELPQIELPLGLADLAPQPRTVSWFAFGAHESLLLFTDGLLEGRGRDGLFFPIEDVLPGLSLGPSRQLSHRIWEAYRSHVGGRQTDDVAVLTLRRSPTRRMPEEPRV